MTHPQAAVNTTPPAWPHPHRDVTHQPSHHLGGPRRSLLSYWTAETEAKAKEVIPREHFVLRAEDARDEYFTDDRMLTVKQDIHNNYRSNPKSLVDYLLEALELFGNEELLDLGCGNGFLLELLAPNMREGEITGLDIAPGVLVLAEERMKNSGVPCRWITGSADNLSMLDDSSFDRVMANFMMHYVVDIAESVREARRVLRRGGRFVLTTDSSKSMVEMYEVHFSALTDMNAPKRLFKSSPKGRISYDNANEWLYGSFEKVVVIDQEDQLRFTVSQPFMDFYSRGHNYCCAATAGREGLPVDFFTELHERVEEKVNKIIDERGQFTVTKLAGLFVAS